MSQISRRGFVGAAIAAVVGLVTVGLAKKRAADEIKGSGRETVKAPTRILPDRLSRFNDVRITQRLHGGTPTVSVVAKRPPSDLSRDELMLEMRMQRYVQGAGGECLLVRPCEGHTLWAVRNPHIDGAGWSADIVPV